MILAISPHLDDVAFSCGGYLYDRARAGTRVRCLTVFTASVPEPTGFALACQLDKGLDPGVDYLQLRRAEDRNACRRLRVEPLHWDFPEAPHRGYSSAPALFAGILPDDRLDTTALDRRLRALLRQHQPTEVLYPFGAGNHADHLQVIGAVGRIRPEFPDIRYRQYYDMPYARKFRDRYPELDTTVPARCLSGQTFTAKLAACRAYTTQLAFQFGSADNVATVLGDREYLYCPPPKS
ncbi:PIG-L family deacetylase [Lewinella sp. JB7]|uniref:PIG-L deacetylase family protein n=1 Tax=Lewinella sp. JB7 TaxID=2962887 RepID=UPI0020C978DC|nr:PIG-L family deacetylase [Lewinella sp. JB7]